MSTRKVEGPLVPRVSYSDLNPELVTVLRDGPEKPPKRVLDPRRTLNAEDPKLSPRKGYLWGEPSLYEEWGPGGMVAKI